MACGAVRWPVDGIDCRPVPRTCILCGAMRPLVGNGGCQRKRPLRRVLGTNRVREALRKSYVGIAGSTTSPASLCSPLLAMGGEPTPRFGRRCRWGERWSRTAPWCCGQVVTCSKNGLIVLRDLGVRNSVSWSCPLPRLQFREDCTSLGQLAVVRSQRRLRLRPVVESKQTVGVSHARVVCPCLLGRVEARDLGVFNARVPASVQSDTAW
jgi:hypothetical protein